MLKAEATGASRNVVIFYQTTQKTAVITVTVGYQDIFALRER
jgi:hypothetical protein